MSEIQQKIDTILQKRKIGVENIVAQEKVISDLKNSIFEIKKKIKESNLDNANSYVSRLEDAERKLSDATQKLDHLKKRFDRDTINVGVAGVTHAGKSTLLQAISGLDNEVLPKAVKGDNYSQPTTATRSQIYNGAKGAEIEFRTESDYLEFVNEYVEKLVSVSIPKFYSTSDFGNFDFAAYDEQVKIGNESDNYKRLRGIQEAFKYFHPLLTGRIQTISGNDFDQLKKFVKYSYNKAEDRLYPAVKNIKICNTFSGIDPELKLGLIDLPGFGENDNVDKIMIKGLENDVDFAILIIRPTNANDGLMKEGRANFDRINEVQKGISKRSDFLSILLNKDLSLGDLLEDCIGSAKKSIEENYNRHGENFTTFEFPLEVNGKVNQDDVSKMLPTILDKLINVLPKMDEELLEAYKKTLDISDVKALLTEIMKEVRKNSGEFSSHTRFDDLRDELYNSLKVDLMNLYEYDDSPYSCVNSGEIDGKPLTENVNSIRQQVDEHIKGDFWVVPQKTFPRYDNWMEWAKVENLGMDGSWLGRECHRLWVSIINDYEKLDETIFTKKLTELKTDIVHVFKKHTGQLVTKDGTAAIDEIIATLEGENFKPDEPLLNAFKYLQGLKIDFRQNVYPYFFKDGINETLSYKLGKIVDNGKGIDDYREQLEIFASETNYKIANAIKEHDFLDYFAYCSAMTFTERLVLSNPKSHDYKLLCTIFCDKMYPNEFGVNSNRMIMRELEKYLNIAISLVDKF